MDKIIEQNLEKTKQAIREYDCVPKVHEWMKIAKEHNFLSVTTLKFIYNKSFYDICKEIRKNII